MVWDYLVLVKRRKKRHLPAPVSAAVLRLRRNLHHRIGHYQNQRRGSKTARCSVRFERYRSKQVLVTELVFTEDNAAGTYYKLTDGTYTMEEPTPGTEGSYASTTTKYKKEVVVTLKGESQTQTDVQGEVDDNGVMKFTGLGEGTYTLTEVTAPNGYNKIDPIEFTVSFNPDSKEFSSDDENMTYNGVSGELEVTIVNLPGSTLPSTGGIGTTIFYVIGSALVLGTVVALVVKRRMNDEDIG